MSDAHAIRLENVSKSFGNQQVLQEVSFAVDRGTACCVLGRSGTGKSVTLKLLIGLLKPDHGNIFVEDQEITHLTEVELAAARKRIGFLFQNAALFDSISVGENVAFPLRRHTTNSDQEVRERATEKLFAVGLQKDYEKMPADLSGGMRKRAGLARALALDPSILLVDEPSAGLDPITTAEIDNLLMQLKTTQGTSLVVVTHNIPSARRISDKLIVLDQGSIIAEGTVEELERSDNAVVTEFMKSSQGG
jgi:phospholipid/cholesterol/gamma-HCH transport system ATP-binding protein